MAKEAAAVQPSVARIVGQNEGGPNAPADHTPQAHVQTSQSCSRRSQRTQEADEERLQARQKERRPRRLRSRQRAGCVQRNAVKLAVPLRGPKSCATIMTKKTLPSEPAIITMDMYVPSIS